MRVKCIAIGNRLMGDDSIGIKIIEELKSELESKDVQVILGETDVYYTLNEINDGDFLIIIDSTLFYINPGCVTFMPIKNCIQSHKEIISQHEQNLIQLLPVYNKQVDGYFIGIEVANITFSMELSKELSGSYKKIVRDVHQIILNILKENQYA